MPSIARRCFLTATAIVVALLAIDLLAGTAPGLSPNLRRFVDITKEGNLPTAVSVLFLTCTALTAFACARMARRANSPGSEVMGWIGLAIFFAYMAVDDAFRIHEETATDFSRLLKENAREWAITGWFLSFPSYYWQLLFLPLFGGFGLFMLVFLLRRLPTRGTRILLLAGLGCYVCAVLLDFLEGSDRLFWSIAESLGAILTVPQTRHLMRAYEEAIEMIGTAAIASSMLAVWWRHGDDEPMLASPADRTD